MGQVKNASAIAEAEGVTRARVCQLLRLLRLAPEVLADLDDVEGTGAVPSEAKLRRLARFEVHEEQLAEYQDLVEAEQTPKKVRQLYRRGFQHLFAEGRKLAAILEAGEARSYQDLGRQVGLSGDRVGQLVRLTGLDPSIIEVLDVPAEDLPAGVTKKLLRKLAAEPDVAAQRRMLAGHLLSGSCALGRQQLLRRPARQSG